MNEATVSPASAKLAGSGRLVRVLKRTGLYVGAVLLALLAGHIIWVSSGSNEWKVVSDKDGIRVATLKTPGYSVFKYKVNMHVDQDLSGVVFYMTDLHTGADVGATDLRRIEKVSADPVSYVYDTYKLDLPRPFHQIEVMIVNQYHQDPVTKQVKLDVYAAPNREPLKQGITRLVHLANTWTLTPVASGGVDIESISEMDLGIPYVLANLAMPALVAEEFDKMRQMLKKDRYKNQKPAFISEPHEQQNVADAGL
jgi:hypothetical protein